MAVTAEERAYVEMIGTAWQLVAQKTETPQARKKIVKQLYRVLLAYEDAADAAKKS